MLLIAVNKTEGRHHIELVNKLIVKMLFILLSLLSSRLNSRQHNLYLCGLNEMFYRLIWRLLSKKKTP